MRSCPIHDAFEMTCGDCRAEYTEAELERIEAVFMPLAGGPKPPLEGAPRRAGRRTDEEIKQIAALVSDECERRANHAALVAAVMNLSADMHGGSLRPCDSCAALTRALGKPFGCDALRVLYDSRPSQSAGEK